MKEKIDFVITWVDESDALWKKSKDNYALEYNMKLNDASRYRDWGFLKILVSFCRKKCPMGESDLLCNRRSSSRMVRFIL